MSMWVSQSQLDDLIRDSASIALHGRQADVYVRSVWLAAPVIADVSFWSITTNLLVSFSEPDRTFAVQLSRFTFLIALGFQ